MTSIDIRARLQAGEAIDPPTLIALLYEIERLRRWKDEALAVLSEWEKTWVAAGRPGRLGTSKAGSVRQEIERLRGDTEWEYGTESVEDDGEGPRPLSEDRAYWPTGITAHASEPDEHTARQIVAGWGNATLIRRRAAGPWEPVEGGTLARHARDSGA